MNNSSQSRYCRCIMHVLGKSMKYNPYAVCRSRISTKKSNCLDSYHFEDFKTEELKGYAKFKKLKDSDTIDKYSRQDIIDLLYKFVIVSKSIDVWNVYKQKFKDHPNLPYKELLKQASIQYNLEKQKLLSKYLQ